MRDLQICADTKHRADDASTNIDRRAPVVRIFTLSELDIDALAEAIRLLLGPETAANRADINLLSCDRGVTHVVEANEAP